MNITRRGFAVLGAMALLAGSAWAQDVPAGYPADYVKVIESGKAEGKIVIYTSTDMAQAQGLLDAFTRKYGIAVEYNDLGTNGAYNRAISEAAARQMGADVVWSSAMDLQVTLAADGYAQTYASPEAAHLPEWAVYKDQIYATTVEPIGVIYNTGAIKPQDFPKTRPELIAYLNDNAEALKGKVATFDPEKSGTGFLHHTNDAQATESFWDLARAMGKDGVRTYSSSGAMRETVVSGENVMAINIIGSYAMDWVKDSPNLGVAFGTDYTAAFSRLALLTEGAPHPEAGKLFIDFMLSQEGQNALAKGGLPSIRNDVTEGLSFDALNAEVGGSLKPIAVSDDLLTYMAPQKRVEFFREWNTALGK